MLPADRKRTRINDLGDLRRDLREDVRSSPLVSSGPEVRSARAFGTNASSSSNVVELKDERPEDEVLEWDWSLKNKRRATRRLASSSKRGCYASRGKIHETPSNDARIRSPTGKQRKAFFVDRQREYQSEPRAMRSLLRDSNDERQTKKRQIESSRNDRQTTWGREGAPETVNDLIPTCLDEDLETIFDHVPELQKTQYLARFEAYDDSTPYETSDWCCWCQQLLDQLKGTNNVAAANYTLLKKAGHSYTADFLDEVRTAASLKLELQTMSTRSLARCLGKIVYHQQKKDSVIIAADLKKGQYGCETNRSVYQRVIELHYCRVDQLPEQQFVAEVFQAVCFKLPKFDRERLINDVYRAYPKLQALLQGDDEEQSNTSEANSSDADDFLYGRGMMPKGEKAVSRFCRFLLKRACFKSNAMVERQFMRLCGDPDDPTFGLLRPIRESIREGIRDSMREGIREGIRDPMREGIRDPIRETRDFIREGVRESREQPTTAAAFRVPLEEIAAATLTYDTKGSTPPVSRRNSKKDRDLRNPTAQPGKYCSRCKNRNHDTHECWTKYPERKKVMRESGKKQKARNLKQRPLLQGNESQRRITQGSTRGKASRRVFSNFTERKGEHSQENGRRQRSPLPPFDEPERRLGQMSPQPSQERAESSSLVKEKFEDLPEKDEYLSRTTVVLKREEDEDGFKPNLPTVSQEA